MQRNGRHFFTSESVTEGHPDKVCDQISDGVLDEIMKDDPMGRVACETFISRGMIIVGGEITTKTYVNAAISITPDDVNGIGESHTLRPRAIAMRKRLVIYGLLKIDGRVMPMP